MLCTVSFIPSSFSFLHSLLLSIPFSLYLTQPRIIWEESQ